MDTPMATVVMDTETYRNYFLFAVYNFETNGVNYVESFNDSKLNHNTIRKVMQNYTVVSFNGNAYDLPMITYAISGKTNNQLKKLSDQLIKSKLPSWAICRDNNIQIPNNWDHIDLIEVAPGMASLKIYGGRLNAKRMQDLPIEPDAILTRAQADALRDYCLNDLRTTALLYKQLTPQIELRQAMSDQYGLDLRSKSDAQIAEAVIKSELEKLTGKIYRAPKLAEDYSFYYQDPAIISFETEQLQEVYARILEHKFILKPNGGPELPEWLSKTKLKIGQSEYQMGIGGLHSTEKSQYICKTDDQILCDMDVASYYPNIILQQKLYPESLGESFLKVYQSIVDRRIEAKRNNDKVTADTLKICVNGSFGKFGSRYSMLYSPDLLIQTTITGQLALLMLIEQLELAGIRVVSGNTDGIVILCDKDKELLLNSIAFDWMLTTSYELERTNYRCIASRDVNNYVAVRTDGKYKGKGIFTEPGIAKNPDGLIIYESVAKFIAKGDDIKQTIKTCSDITKFITIRRVDGGGIWNENYLGKAVRFYHSSTVDKNICIHYAKNLNRVPNSAGCRPLMDLPDCLPNDIDYDYYIQEAYDILKEIGYDMR
jgi:DNA polymerase elongation subunit (family B)